MGFRTVQEIINWAWDSAKKRLKVDIGTAAPATETKQDVLAALIGAINDAAVVDPAGTGSQIALLKGLIKQLQGDGTAGKAAPVSLSGSITPEQTEVSVETTTTAVLAANTDRKYALFINDSNEAIYLKLGTDAELNKGIRINADGGSYEMSAGLGNLYTGAINSICTSGSKTLLVTEGVLEI